MKKQKKNISLNYPNLIATEGTDAKMFLIHYLNYLISNGIISDNLFQVEDYGGIDELRLFLGQFDSVQLKKLNTIIIIRDAETNAPGALQSVVNTLASLQIDTPNHCLLFPNFDETTNGTLEDLCLKIVKNDKKSELLNISDNAVASANEIKKLTKIHKNKLHTYLSLQDKYAGLKIGESANAGAFDFSAPELEPLCKILCEIERNATSA
jgi:hypothetical protein